MLKKLFGFDPSVTTPRTEILAGVTTFLTMSYILAVNPGMFSQLDGMPAGAVFTARHNRYAYHVALGQAPLRTGARNGT